VLTVEATLPDGRHYERPATVDVTTEVTRAWQHNIGGAVQSRLVRDGDLLYVTSMGNDLVALNPADGSEKFRTKTDGPIFSSPCVTDAVAYFGSADHYVYAVDAKTGQQKWKAKTDGAVLAGPNVAQGIVCVGSTDTNIYGLDINDGHYVWTVPGHNMYQSQTATDGDHFFVGGWDNHFRCIDAKTGHVAWDLELGKPQKLPGFSSYAPAITSPAVGAGNVFVSTNDGILHALNIADGTEAWRVDWKKMGYSSPCYHDGRVYCALSDEGKTFCVNADSGEMLWTADTGSVIYDSSFCFGGGNVFIGCVNGTASAIRAADGKLLWQYRLGPGHLLASPAADDQLVYFSSLSGDVTALPVNSNPAARR
jgi:outer membrane protein assembly factor BamB